MRKKLDFQTTGNKTGKALERKVANLYRAMGAWKVEHDVWLAGHQIDVYVEMGGQDGWLHRIAVEVKDWQRPVGIEVVRDWTLVVDSLRRAGLVDEGVIVSIEGFTKPARRAADEHDSRGTPTRLLELADLQHCVGIDLVKLPIYVIPAGEPMSVLDSRSFLMSEETITLPYDMLGDPDGLYALQVQGNSMIDALVHDGDIVIMRRQQWVETNEMAVIWLKEEDGDGRITLKYLHREGNLVWLRPANSDMKPVRMDARQVEVQGKVVMVIRQLQ